MSRDAEQQRIAGWFDRTYRTKGVGYLRPVRAYYVFAELLGVREGSRLLDVACGAGQMLLAAREYGCACTGIDLSGEALALAAGRVPGATLTLANAESIPFPDGSFDALTCLGSLERMLDRPRALAEMRRVTADGARLCFLVRNADTFSFRYLTGSAEARRERGHQDAGTLASWRELFESAGFDVLQVLPDQYPLQRRAKWMRLGLGKIDYRTPRTSGRPLERANEFVFVLEKRS